MGAKLVVQMDVESHRRAVSARALTRAALNAMALDELGGQLRGGDIQVGVSDDAPFLVLQRVLASVLVAGGSSARLVWSGKSQEVSLGLRHLSPGEEGLLIFVVDDGASIKGPGGNVAPGCSGIGEGLAVPKRAGARDYEGLRRCAERVRLAAGVARYFLAVGAKVPFSEVRQTIEALEAARLDLVGLRLFF